MRARRHGLLLRVYNLIGLPDETPETIAETIRLNRACQLIALDRWIRTSAPLFLLWSRIRNLPGGPMMHLLLHRAVLR